MAPASIHNPGFESGADGWRQTTYGAAPIVSSDSDVIHSGKRSLRITATSPSDTALSQDLALSPGRLYRLTGWVRTRALNAMGSPVFGTIQVQGKGGQPIVASAPSHGGNSDWSKITMFFRAPADGIANLALFFVGFGKGIGTAWFDDIALKSIDSSNAVVKIKPNLLSSAPISPFQYGQFIEYLCDLVPSMWAEKLYDGSFEGLTPYTMAYNRATDFKEQPWHTIGPEDSIRFSRDHENPVSGEMCGKIEALDTRTGRVGISQDGIAVEAGIACTVSCWLRSDGKSGPVTVRLHQGAATYAACEFTPGPEWKKFSARMRPRERALDATLSIELSRPGSLWIDNASLMPENSVAGWRRDVVAAVREMKPGIVRFGGSALDDGNLGSFEWKDTIGDSDHRKPFRAWGGLQPTGPGIEEIVQFCGLVGAEPLICVRIRGKTASDAAEQVEYFNGSPNTRMGNERARNGHREPYHIKFWQVGNEQAGPQYDSRLAEFCRAMRAADPGIKILASFPTPGVLKSAGDIIDFVCPHHYSCADIAGTRADLDSVRNMIREYAPNRNIKVAVTEWNTTAGDWGAARANLWTLANGLACARYQNLLHRQCDLVEIANRSNLIDSFCSGFIQANRHTLYKTPAYYAQQLYSTNGGRRPLQIESEVPTDMGLDLSAAISENGSELTLFAVNDGPTPEIRTVDISSFHLKSQFAERWILGDKQGSGRSDVSNSFEAPTRIAPVSNRMKAGPKLTGLRFEPYSLTVLRWRISPP